MEKENLSFMFRNQSDEIPGVKWLTRLAANRRSRGKACWSIPLKWGCQKNDQDKNGVRKLMTTSSEMVSLSCEFSADETGKSSANRGRTNKKVPAFVKKPPPVNLRIR